MPAIGEQADILRALGRFLDDQEASGIQIRAHEIVLQVSWAQAKPGDETRAYQEHDLADLREQARAMRQGGTSSPSGSLAELLRTLGQELDEDGLEANGIVQEEDGFRVSGVIDGRYASQFYTNEDLLARSEERRLARGSVGEPDPIADLIAEVTVGAIVITRDDQRIGKVGELRGRHFKVDAGLLQRAFWLPAECLASIDGDHVYLAHSKNELEPHKSRSAPVGA